MPKFLNHINRLHVNVRITNYYLFNIVLNIITPILRLARAHYNYLCFDHSEWKEKLL